MTEIIVNLEKKKIDLMNTLKSPSVFLRQETYKKPPTLSFFFFLIKEGLFVSYRTVNLRVISFVLNHKGQPFLSCFKKENEGTDST